MRTYPGQRNSMTDPWVIPGALCPRTCHNCGFVDIWEESSQLSKSQGKTNHHWRKDICSVTLPWQRSQGSKYLSFSLTPHFSFHQQTQFGLALFYLIVFSSVSFGASLPLVPWSSRLECPSGLQGHRLGISGKLADQLLGSFKCDFLLLSSFFFFWSFS